jgi:predicted O-methyltransferase YrrM
LSFDFAFIDGDHSYDAVAADFEMVKRCGAVLFHDYVPGNEVARFIDELPQDQVSRMDMFGFWQYRAPK